MHALANLNVENSKHAIGPPIQQYDVAANHHVRGVGWWRRQSPLQFLWAGLDAFLQAGRQRATFHELLLESGGQLIFLRQP